MRVRQAGLLVAVLATMAALGGCGAAAGDGEGDRTLTVLAAASLRGSFDILAREFEREQRDGVRVVLSYGASSSLAEQVRRGSPADVFASASEETMSRVVDDGAAEDPEVFAHNTMTVVVPAANPAHIRRLPDLARPGVKVAVCQRQVPCGSVAARVLAAARVPVRPATEEADVRAVLAKVRLGEVDAGLVYVTDARAAGAAVREVAVPSDVNATTAYLIAVLRDGRQRDVARRFVDFVRSSEGQRVLAAAGFSPP